MDKEVNSQKKRISMDRMSPKDFHMYKNPKDFHMYKTFRRTINYTRH